MKGCGEVKGTVPLQGVHRLVVQVVLGSQLGLNVGTGLWAACGQWEVGEPERSLALQTGQIVNKGASRAQGTERGHRQRKPGGGGSWS